MVESRAVPENTASVPEGTASVPEKIAAPGAGHALGHGNSVAAWTAVVVILVGALVAALAVIFRSIWLFVLGAVIVALGAVTGKLLSAMGFGAPH